MPDYAIMYGATDVARRFLLLVVRLIFHFHAPIFAINADLHSRNVA